jgi:hypothetical protein
VDQLTSTYPSFVAQTVVPEENNLIYVRGAAVDPTSAASATVTIFNVTNELILWPQVLKESTVVGSIPLTFDPSAAVPDGETAGGELHILSLIKHMRF